LARHGRRVYLAVRRCWWWPFRYRGNDTFWWVVEQGLLKRPAPPPTSPLALISPQVTGVDGGRTLNLHTLARDGLALLGHFMGVTGRTLQFAADLAEQIAAADEQARRIIDGIDAFAAERGMTGLAPDDVRGNAALWTHEASDPIRELDLDAAGIATVVWATGYRPAFEWVDLPVFDEAGAPRHEYGVGSCPGLYFPALQQADSFPGITLDAASISAAILARAPRAEHDTRS
jgi:putative flavoprotein involved in K+ transport